MAVSTIIARATAFCEHHKYRLTEPRLRVLTLLVNEKKALGAYDILSLLTTKDSRPKPPTIYRAIDFWVEHGFIHKVESTNAFLACAHDHCHGNFYLLICDHCEVVKELIVESLPKTILSLLKKQGFSMRRSTTEVYGLCGQCI